MTGKDKDDKDNNGSNPQRNATDPPDSARRPPQNQHQNQANALPWAMNRPAEPRPFPFAPPPLEFFGIGAPQPNPPAPPALFNARMGETENQSRERLREVHPSPPPTPTRAFGNSQQLNNSSGTGQDSSSTNLSSEPLNVWNQPPNANERGQITAADYGYFPKGPFTTETVPPTTSSISDMNGSEKLDSNSNKRSASSDTELSSEAKRLKISNSNEDRNPDRPIIVIVPIIFGANRGGTGEGVSEQARGGDSSNISINLNSSSPVVNISTDGNTTNVRIDPSSIGSSPLARAPARDPNQVAEASRKEEEEGLEANQNQAIDADGSQEEEEASQVNGGSSSENKTKAGKTVYGVTEEDL